MCSSANVLPEITKKEKRSDKKKEGRKEGRTVGRKDERQGKNKNTFFQHGFFNS